MDIKRFQFLCAERNYTRHWTLAQWGNALAGEVGETCNVIKKIERGDLAGREAEGLALLAAELPDALTYLCLLASAAGIDLETATVGKFNEVSERLGSPIKAP